MPENIVAKLQRADGIPIGVPHRYDVVAIGRANTDVIADVSDTFLHEHGIPANGEKDCSADELRTLQALLDNAQVQAGGAAANSMAVVSALGGRAGFFGKVCDDNNGKIFLNDFKRRNVGICCPPYTSDPDASSTCLVLLNDGKRSLAYSSGGGGRFSAQDFTNFDFSLTHSLLVEAYLLAGANTRAKTAVMEAFKQAEGRCRIAVNLQSVLDWNGYEDVLRHILQYADVIIGNEEEQAALTAAKSGLPQKAGQLMITTRGENGVDVMTATGILHVPAAVSENFVSSVGAGDAFIGAFLLGQARGLEVEECVHLAVRIASKAVEEYGARPTRSLQHYFPGAKAGQEPYPGRGG